MRPEVKKEGAPTAIEANARAYTLSPTHNDTPSLGKLGNYMAQGPCKRKRERESEFSVFTPKDGGKGIHEDEQQKIDVGSQFRLAGSLYTAMK